MRSGTQDSKFISLGTDTRKKERFMGKKGIRYTPDLPHRLYTYFNGYTESGAPSFDKFARSIGATLEELVHFKRHKEFCRAWQECNEIRRDYLIDTALAKRADSSLVKFLLGAEFGMGDKDKDDEAGALEVTVEVIGE